MNKQLILEKYIKVAVRKALKEQEQQQQKAEKAMYLIYRFPGLKKVIEDLMSPAFGRFVSDIKITAPKPTTFSISLINGEEFSVTYVGRDNFRVKIAGRKYDPSNIGELERASQAIADVLALNYAPSTTKAEDQTTEQAAAPSGPPAGELAADLTAAGETTTPPPTETPAETPPIETPEEKSKETPTA
jgi:hypothetical protein